MYRLAILDDDRLWADTIGRQVETVCRVLGIEHSCQTFYSSEFFRYALENGVGVDLLLADVCLEGGKNTIKLAAAWRETAPDLKIALFSSEEDYVYDGYAIRAEVFFTKPINENKLADFLIRAVKEHNQRHMIRIRQVDGERVLLRAGDIYYCEHAYGISKIHHKKGQCSSKKRLGELLEHLPRESFLSCHQSYLVNLSYVQKLERYSFTLVNGEEVPVTKLAFNRIREQYENYLLKILQKEI